MPCIVSNSSPLIGLASIGSLSLLRDLWGAIFIPQAVHKETAIEGGGRTGAAAIALACTQWIEVLEVSNKPEVNALTAVLDQGEAEAITLSQEKNADYILLDNREPRLFARSLGLKPIGTLGIIKLAYDKRLISNPLTKAHELKSQGFWLSDSLMKKFEQDIGNRQ